MEIPQSEAKSQSEAKRLEYRSPSVAKLGKLGDVTLAVGDESNLDGGTGDHNKSHD